jgi:hypothetical protein
VSKDVRTLLRTEMKVLRLPRWSQEMERILAELMYTAQERHIISDFGLGRDMNELRRIYELIRLARKYAQSGESIDHLRM